MTTATTPRDPTTILTPQQVAVLRLMLTGHTAAEIAATLGIAPNTVKAHLRDIQNRTGQYGPGWRLRLITIIQRAVERS